MTLSDFRDATAHLPGDLDLRVLAPWGEIDDAVLVNAADLDPADPVREALESSPMVLISAEYPALVQ